MGSGGGSGPLRLREAPFGGWGGQGVRDLNSEPGQGRSHKEACVCPMIGHAMAWGGECGVYGQIAGWYKGNEGGEELARCGGAIGWGWHGGAVP